MSQLVPGGDRAAKWDRRYDPEHIKVVTTAEKPIYSAHAHTKFDDLYEMEISVKQVLNSSGISTFQTASYLAFARMIWKAKQTYHGETLAQEAAVVIAKVVARGLTQAICQAIRSQVFDIGAPIAP